MQRTPVCSLPRCVRSDRSSFLFQIVYYLFKNLISHRPFRVSSLFSRDNHYLEIGFYKISTCDFFYFHFLHIHVSLSSLTSYLAETVNPKTTFPRWLCRLDGHCGLDFTKKMHSVNLWNEESNTRPLPLLRRRAFPAWHWGSLLWQWWQRSWLMSWARLWMGSHPFQLLHLAMGHPNGVPRAFLRPCQLPNTLNKSFFFP